jgi:hypothetical protein
MLNDEARLAALRGRCTPDAIAQLEEFRQHALFPELVLALEAVPEKIYSADVQGAFYKIVKGKLAAE